MSILEQVFGSRSERTVRSLTPLVAQINALEENYRELLPSGLTETGLSLRARVRGGEPLDTLLPESFALVREAARRTLGERHYDVQLMGGILLHRGGIVEMKTGEGKTLVATLPVFLNALTGRGVHVVTVNDYLSRRDAVWMGQVYALLGMSVGILNHSVSFRYNPKTLDNSLDSARDETGSFHIVHEFLTPCEKREAYECDITYGTNNEFGFDYLRDNIAYRPDQLVQREHTYAIVDEIDSILIDEARTPLIISAQTAESEELYHTFARMAREFVVGEDYTIDEKAKTILTTDAGITKAEKILGVGDIYTEKGMKYVHHLETALRARALFERDKEYVVNPSADGGQVIIVDEFTGRLQPGRRWSEGLHQAIEAKEGVTVERESRTVASITYQNYFRMYEKLSGMTGTALTSAEEFHKVYGREVTAIPSNVPSRRSDKSDLIFKTEQGKFTAVARAVKALHEKGQPVLVGTASIEKNEVLSAYFTRAGVPHQVLNAKNHEKEGEIISDAGKRGSVVIATNMAGRGVDIKLGGALATQEEREAVRTLGGLYVIGTERHEARRIDNQLRGRSGRQGDPGETQFYISLEDDLARVFGPGRERIKAIYERFGVAEDEPIEASIISRIIENAQSKIEGLNFDARKHVLEYDDVMSHQRTIMYERRRALLVGKEEDLNSFVERLSEYAGSTGEAGRTIETIQKKDAELGHELFLQAVRQLALQTIDTLWVEHLEAMDYLRGSVSLRAYGQRDPLIEYKREGLRLFKDLEEAVFNNILNLLPHVAPAPESTLQTIGPTVESGEQDKVGLPRRSSDFGGAKVGRNDPCPCGSGKKYKKCHGAA